MFYDIFLDEFLYLRKEENVSDSVTPDIFCGLVPYTESEINSFKNGKVIILRKEKDLSNFLKMSRNVITNNSKLYFGKINSILADNVKLFYSHDICKFNLSLQTHVLKHIQKRHGNPIKELARGQIHVVDSDFRLIPYIVNEADSIELSKAFTEYNNQVLIFKKQIRDVLYQIVIYVSLKRHNLEIKTMYKRKKNSFTAL